jgi:hypothetical protein
MGGVEMQIDLQKLVRQWGSPFVARTEVERFSGGILSAKYLANLDSLNSGPPGRIRIGRKVAYDVEKLVQWMEERAAVAER